MTRQLSTEVDGPVAPPRPGDLLGGKYRVEREIGSGGMGVVYEVTHLVMTERRFAVKWLVPADDDGEAARRFVREARIAGRIRHPNVVDVYDINLGADGCFIVMELLEGESLDQRVERSGALPVAEACQVMLGCLAGVGAAHAVGVIHRDLKPANIFLCRTSEPQRWHPKVVDFGISRTLEQAGTAQSSTETRKGTLVGTPAYMAPEQLRGAACDARTDVYAVGVSLYEALSGRRAFEAPTYADLIARVVNGNAVPLEALVPEVPIGLCHVVACAMHRDPGQRFGSAAELAQNLEPFTLEPRPQRLRGRSLRRQIGWWVGVPAIAVGIAVGATRLSSRTGDRGRTLPAATRDVAAHPAASGSPPHLPSAAEPPTPEPPTQTLAMPATEAAAPSAPPLDPGSAPARAQAHPSPTHPPAAPRATPLAKPQKPERKRGTGQPNASPARKLERDNLRRPELAPKSDRKPKPRLTEL